MGQLMGIDYIAADIIWRRAGTELTTEDFAGFMLFSKTIIQLIQDKQ